MAVPVRMTDERTVPQLDQQQTQIDLILRRPTEPQGRPMEEDAYATNLSITSHLAQSPTCTGRLFDPMDGEGARPRVDPHPNQLCPATTVSSAAQSRRQMLGEDADDGAGGGGRELQKGGGRGKRGDREKKIKKGREDGFKEEEVQKEKEHRKEDWD